MKARRLPIETSTFQANMVILCMFIDGRHTSYFNQLLCQNHPDIFLWKSDSTTIQIVNTHSPAVHLDLPYSISHRKLIIRLNTMLTKLLLFRQRRLVIFRRETWSDKIPISFFLNNIFLSSSMKSIISSWQFKNVTRAVWNLNFENLGSGIPNTPKCHY